MPMAAGFLAGIVATVVVVLGALGGAFFRLLSGEDDFDAEDPADECVPPRSPHAQEA